MRDPRDEKPRGQSLTAPGMTYEMESACHILSRGILKDFLEQKYGVDGWVIDEIERASYKERNVAVLTRAALAANAVECGLKELRRQLRLYDEENPQDEMSL